ncbi:MAG: proline--tRNA ligase [bacterium]
MKQSILFGKSLKESPKDAETVSHQLLVRGGFIQNVAAGLWSYLPLGWRVFKKIENIIREEMNAIGGQEVNLPALVPKEYWEESGRWEKMDPPLFKLKDRHSRELALGSTHEEVMTDMVRRYNLSYKDLPFALYQIQNKFRNEMRASGGLLRVREFVMKDLYSFHADENDLADYYQKVIKAYQNIFHRCGLEAAIVDASSGSIGGNCCNEFMVLADSGEDFIFLCSKCGYAANLELGKKEVCPKCQSKLKSQKAIEAAHIFKLDTHYSQKLKLAYVDAGGKKHFIQMGCYGIGLGRLLATIVEASHDRNGIIWPKEVSPFAVHLLSLGKVAEKAKKIYNVLTKEGIDVLYDDRDLSAGAKFAEADLIGISARLVISDKTGDQVELKQRSEKKVALIGLPEAIKKLS